MAAGNGTRSRALGYALAVAALLALILLLVLGTATSGTAPAATSEGADPAERPLGAFSSEAPQLPAPDPLKPLAYEGEPAQPPIIDSITLEKQRVCVGEENLVTIEAHTPGNVDDAYLSIQLGGQRGARIPIVGYASDLDVENADEPRMVVVAGRNGKVTTAELPPFEVENCAVPARLRIRAQLMTNTVDEVELYAQVIPGAKTFAPVRYRWDLGDGTTAVTDVPVLRHDFGPSKSDDALETSFLVTCTAVAEDGAELVGRRSITRMSGAFINLAYKGVVLLERMMTPRFPIADEDGDVEQEATVWHSYEVPVRLTEAFRVEYPAHRGEPTRTKVDPGVLVGRTVLQPDDPITFPVALDGTVPDDVAFVEYQLHGVAEDGRVASGIVTVLRPPPPPGSGEGQPVMDPMLAARIVRAQELLGRRMVNDEDLRRLEREGAFAGLAPLADYTPPEGADPPTFPPPR